MAIQTADTKEITARGAEIYDRLYRSEFELNWSGRYAAIDIDTERAFVDDFPEQVMEKARAALPGRLFYIVRIGSDGAFKISRRASNDRARSI